MEQFTQNQITQIQSIVNSTIQTNTYRYPKITPHRHDGVDNVKIPTSSVIPNVASLGKIKFANNKTYTLNFAAGSPSLILFNGLAFQTGAGDNYAIVDGNAVITKTYEFQPQTTSSVIVGGTPFPINGILAQCSSNLYIVPGTGGSAFGHVDQNFIVNVLVSGSPNVYIVTGQLINIKPNSVDFQVTNLASGWELVGNFTII